jgi:hypothetical protein
MQDNNDTVYRDVLVRGLQKVGTNGSRQLESCLFIYSRLDSRVILVILKMSVIIGQYMMLQSIG